MRHLITRHAITYQAPQLYEFLSCHPSIDSTPVKLVKMNSNSVTYVCTGFFVVQGHQVSEPSFWGGWQSRRIRPVNGSVILMLFLNVLALLTLYSGLYNSSNVMLFSIHYCRIWLHPLRVFCRCLSGCQFSACKWYFEFWIFWTFHAGGKEHSDLLMRTSLRISRAWMDAFPEGNRICCAFRYPWAPR